MNQWQRPARIRPHTGESLVRRGYPAAARGGRHLQRQRNSPPLLRQPPSRYRRYAQAINLEPDNPLHWRRRAHAYTIAPTPQPEKGVEDATRAIELNPNHAMEYGHRAVALTQLPTPEWEKALADMDRHIELFPRRDPEGYRLRAWVHDNLGNHEEAERDR